MYMYFLTQPFSALAKISVPWVTGYHNNVKFSDGQVWANSKDPDQTAPSGSTLFAILSASFGHIMVKFQGDYSKIFKCF